MRSSWPQAVLKHTSLAVCAHPGPRLLFVSIDAEFEDRAILLVVQVMDVGLVPTFKAAVTPRDRVILDGGVTRNVPVPCF